MTNKPIAVGFGVSRPDHAETLASWGADGVIVGSALVRALGEAATPGALEVEEHVVFFLPPVWWKETWC